MLRKTWVGFFGVVAVAALFRLWQIDVIPSGFHFDESFEGLEAWRILTDPTYRPIFLTGNFGVAPVNAYANALMFGIFSLFGGEPGPTPMRVTAALFGVLGVVATWLVAGELRQLDSQRLTAAFPWFAAVLLATMRWHVHFSRIGIEPILVPLVTAAALWLLLRARRTGSKLAFAGCGAVTALAMYTYQGAWILPLLMAAAWVILWWWERPATYEEANDRSDGVPHIGRTSLVVGGVIAGATAALLVLPLALFALAQPDLFLLRPEQIAGGGEAATQQSFFESARAYVLMFVPLVQAGDLDPRRNLPGLAALNLWQAIPFWFGVGLAIWRVRQPGYSIMLLLLAGLLLPGVLSEYAPHYHRVLGAAAPVALLGGVGLDWIWQWWSERRATRGETILTHGGMKLAWIGWVSVALLIAGAFVSARDYFVRWAPLPDLFYAFDAGLWEIGQEIAAQPAETSIYLTPRDADHPTLAFAWETRPGSHGAPVTFDGRHAFALTAGSNPQPEQYVVIEDEDFRTRLLLPELFPDATVTRTLVDWQGRTYANTYMRPAASVPQRNPSVSAPFEIGDEIALAGYDAQVATLETGRMLYVQLYWDVTAALAQEWTVFVHLLDEQAEGGAQLVAGVDSMPGAGSLPTTRWQAGWRILDEYQISLPADLPAGDYGLSIGLYTAEGARLPADSADVRIGEVTLE
ncbi:MAG: hypothetical protein R6W76_16555 [Caldilinea sp.]